MAVNPFTDHPDRAAIWDMLMPRDFAAFAAQDWHMVEGDFDQTRFLGVHAHGSASPDDWTFAFPVLDAYRVEWLQQAAESAKVTYTSPLAAALLKIVRLDHIDISGDVAIAHKIFDGTLALANGGTERLDWRTVYYCRRNAGRWQISGFTGYLPRTLQRPE